MQFLSFLIEGLEKVSIQYKGGDLALFYGTLRGESEREREQERNFPSGCTDEILLCGVHAYSW